MFITKSKKIIISLVFALLLAFVCIKVYVYDNTDRDIVLQSSLLQPDYIMTVEDFIKECSKSHIFVEHLEKYPQFNALLKKSPRLRTYYISQSIICEEFLKYLNENPKVVEKIYKSKCPAKKYKAVFFNFKKWK